MGVRNILILFFSAMAVSLVILIIVFSLFFNNMNINLNTHPPESAPTGQRFELQDPSSGSGALTDKEDELGIKASESALNVPGKDKASEPSKDDDTQLKLKKDSEKKTASEKKSEPQTKSDDEKEADNAKTSDENDLKPKEATSPVVPVLIPKIAKPKSATETRTNPSSSSRPKPKPEPRKEGEEDNPEPRLTPVPKAPVKSSPVRNPVAPSAPVPDIPPVPAAPSPEGPSAQLPRDGKVYRVFVGGFGSESAAKQAANRYASRGLSPVIRQTGKNRYSVQIGAFGSSRKARELAQQTGAAME